jgi:hypothetical protein
MWQAIDEGIKNAQHLQDTEGAEHPNEVQVFTFNCPALLRWWLKAKRVKGLSFERYNDEWYGIYRAMK